MKKTLTAIILITALVLCPLTVSAEHYWNDSMKFTSAYGSVNVDGKIDAGEWDDAQVISIKLNGDPLDASGNINYQGEWEGDRNDSDYSGIYKVKWDENNIYFLEDRTDDHVNLSATGAEPWTSDGTLIFTQVDNADGSLNPNGVSVHIFYTVGNEGSIGGSLKARVCNMEEATRETIDITGGKITSALKDGGFIVEIAVPWAFYTEQVPNFKAPAAGDKMGLSYVVHDSDADEAGYVKQLCYAIDNDNLGDVPGGYDFGSWGVLELLAAPAVVETTEAAVIEAVSEVVPEVTAAPVQTTTSPVTGDNTIFFLAIMICAIGAFAMMKRSVKVK